ncbi:MAG TPA: carboxypeptidase regulatory-like domain-containing protein [Candidatus Aquilonibacter sp.]|nr:carboxypeptidase regulatory-like domain-containing protein [Candidatus Aquilonibacter sp.]
MKRFIGAGLTFLAFLLLFAGSVAAQGANVTGQIIGLDGNPFPNVTVTIKSDTGRTFTTKTDKNGNFIQVGVPDGIYTVTLASPQLPQGFSTHFQQNSSNPQPWNINLKEIAAASGESGKAEAEKQAFANMKKNFDDATAAMNDGDTIKKQLATATADQKSDLTSKMDADYQTALTDYNAAEQGVGAKDTGNHALIWASIGRADDALAKYDDAATAYQNAINMKPMPDYYSDLSTATVNAAVAQHDPAVLQQKTTDAMSDCDKAVQLANSAPSVPGAPAGGSTSVADRCYKNIGIVLSNKGDLQQAVDPLKKATDANPKDAQAWFLLGSAYVGSVQSKTEGDKEVFIFDPNTADALQKCSDLDPTGALGAQCKDMLSSVNQMSGGVSTSVGEKPAKGKKK